jgi:hypothetical protein
MKLIILHYVSYIVYLHTTRSHAVSRVGTKVLRQGGDEWFQLKGSINNIYIILLSTFYIRHEEPFNHPTTFTIANEKENMLYY